MLHAGWKRSFILRFMSADPLVWTVSLPQPSIPVIQYKLTSKGWGRSSFVPLSLISFHISIFSKTPEGKKKHKKIDEFK